MADETPSPEREGPAGASDTGLKAFATQFAPGQVVVEKDVLGVARTALTIAYGSFLALVAAVILPPILSAVTGHTVMIGVARGDASPIEVFVSSYVIHFLLSLIAIIALIAGYRMVAASGAKSDVVIPTQDYPLLGPLVAEAKSESVDLYVRLSSLRGSTGFFTRLGLTGLPLATIALTLIFSIMAMIQSQQGQFLDLAKLTLGAFIGSFVQRQVERRSDQPRGTKTGSPE
ncbi:MAG TPA: hypothetical protein VF601_23685 [Beijerinckiaceae bacterium]